MDDNATCHRTLAIQDCLTARVFNVSYGHGAFSDLNPIENVWMRFLPLSAGRNYPRTNKNNLIHALTEEWDKLPRTAAG
ncbi:hypothetical protein TNCV_2708441 [Trichonephila clavipes]|nr:hypothetical protein TNCV_2708441 [Trichonephila clavipes]